MQNQQTTESDIAPRINCRAPWRLTSVSLAKDAYALIVKFVDGTSGWVNMKKLVCGKQAGVFACLEDLNFFNQVYLSSYGVVTWPNGIDLPPDVLYQDIKKFGKCTLR